MRRTKKTLPLRQVASEVIQRADTAGRRFAVLAVEAWPEVVGPEIARHTKGYALRDDKEFVVSVDSAAWANQLSLMAEDLRLRLNTHIGENAVNHLRFTVSKRVAKEARWEGVEQETQDFYTPEPTHPRPLDALELQQARHVAAAVRDEALREVALKAMIKDLEHKKGARLRPHQDDPEDRP